MTRTRRNHWVHRGIQRRLIAWLIGPLLLVLIISLASDYHIAHSRADEAFDLALADSVQDIAAHLHRDGQGIRLDLSPQAEEVLRSDKYDAIYFSVRDQRGRLIAGSPGLPLQEAGDGAAIRFYDARYLGKPIRCIAYRVNEAGVEAEVIVAETLRKREMDSQETMLAMVAPNLVLIATTLLILFFGIRISLRPLDDLRREIEHRSPNDLGTLPTGAVPEEVKPIVTALNRLFDLLRESSENQRRFLADAAHQLRTPLTGLQTQLDLLGMSELAENHRETLRHIDAATERITHLVNQLLLLARSDHTTNLGHMRRPVDLGEVVESQVSTFLDRAIAKDIDLGFEATPAAILGVAWLLREALSNLIDNALRYTQAGGRITVRSGTATGQAWLEVEDNGPGIPSEEREHVFERFYRPADSTQEGCGLGLAIVREIAQVHGGEVEIHDPEAGSGTRIRLRFKALPTPA
jgi:two-component system sensor histidine kinase TctE